MTRRLSCVAAACALTLSACAVGPNYHRPAAAPSPAFKDGQGWTPAAPAPITGEAGWAVYSDPVLYSHAGPVGVSSPRPLGTESSSKRPVRSELTTWWIATRSAWVEGVGARPAEGPKAPSLARPRTRLSSS